MPHLPQNGLRVPSNIKFVPTANVLDYGEDLPLHLTTAGLSEKSITFSSAAITRSTEDSGQPLDAIPHVYSDTDTGLIYMKAMIQRSMKVMFLILICQQ